MSKVNSKRMEKEIMNISLGWNKEWAPISSLWTLYIIMRIYHFLPTKTICFLVPRCCESHPGNVAVVVFIKEYNPFAKVR